MAIHMTRGLQATMTFLQNTGTGTRSWMMGPRDIALDSTGWREFHRGNDERERRAGEKYMKEEWHDADVENGEAGEVADGADEGGEAVGLG
jgi:hypothetical protein